MPKVVGPLLSLDARKSIGKTLTFQKRRGVNIVYGYKKPGDVNNFVMSEYQYIQRNKMKDARYNWKGFDQSIRNIYNQSVEGKNLSGYNRYLQMYMTTVHIVLRGFITEWVVSGDATARTITLPLKNTRTEGALVYNFTVDWGDGTTPSVVNAYDSANRIHTYAQNGTYQVEITGICEGWSFYDSASAVKITKVINWGDAPLFEGFKYLANGFFGCTNLNSLPTGSIQARGTGIGVEGFNMTFYNCTSLTTISANLFKNHTEVTKSAFYGTFRNCTGLTSIPADIFKYNTKATTQGFAYTFYGCTNITSIPTDLFRFNTLVTTSAFEGTFDGCTKLVVIPVDLFRYNTEVSNAGFRRTFNSCSLLTTIPDGLFKYNTKAITSAFAYTFQTCPKLKINPWTFYLDGEQSTRFLNQSVYFDWCFYRSSFTGQQGNAPDLWNCNFGTGTPSKGYCFYGSGNNTSSLANYNDIPAAWKS